MIKLAGIEKEYRGTAGPIRALQGVDLGVRAGEIYGIIGKSGAGKSTLIRCINMLEKPTAGRVTVDGEELTTLSDRQLREVRKKIGMIFQHFNLISCRTVLENVAFPLELAGKSRQEIAAEVLPLLELVGLADRRDQYPAQLSGGQKQRVAIARALANKPKVLLCDEATSALDPQTTRAILELLRDINRKLQLTIVLITHEMQVIKEICDRVAVIEDGTIIEQGAVIDLFVRPQTATTREFVRTIINHELPAILTAHDFSPLPHDGSSLMLRIIFLGGSAEEPVIAQIIRKFNIEVNILFGNIDTIQDTLFGTLVVELAGEQAAIKSALHYLQTHDLGIEVIGYVARHHRITG
ncbi:methionine ABC transporter ATP-binding protein [Anaeroselena agilis]|uniref:Methionine ABC transporter ATP-binding protein n=1 Tax=Anaeroselena agilis TaxID=3063788 RepID=A0ABU3NTD0_9FIRM|nr:methionine ABC transporter ATP-binding protein [Selenomonadales bacterium 4137-cl]